VKTWVDGRAGANFVRERTTREARSRARRRERGHERRRAEPRSFVTRRWTTDDALCATREQLRSTAAESELRAQRAEASARAMSTALQIVRKTVEEEKRLWLTELRAARDEGCRLRIELANLKKTATRPARRDFSVLADDASVSASSSSEGEEDDEGLIPLAEAAEALHDLSLTLSEAVSERKVIGKTPRRTSKTKSASAESDRPPPVGETARRALRARHAMKMINYAEPSLKKKLRRPRDDDIACARASDENRPPPATPPVSPVAFGTAPQSPSRDDSTSPKSLITLTAKSPMEIIADVPKQHASLVWREPSPPLYSADSRSARRNVSRINYAEPDLVHKMRRP
jgi:hypothetical protein